MTKPAGDPKQNARPAGYANVMRWEQVRASSTASIPSGHIQAKLSRRAELSPVTLLELLATAAPAGVVPADVVAFRVHDRARRAGGRCRGAAAGHRHRGGTSGARTACSEHRLSAGQRLVLVLQSAAVQGLGLRLLRALELVRLLRRQLRVEERQHNLLVDRCPELREHDVPL